VTLQEEWEYINGPDFFFAGGEKYVISLSIIFVVQEEEAE
jgi:hypothetical protein